METITLTFSPNGVPNEGEIRNALSAMTPDQTIRFKGLDGEIDVKRIDTDMFGVDAMEATDALEALDWVISLLVIHPVLFQVQPYHIRDGKLTMAAVMDILGYLRESVESFYGMVRLRSRGMPDTSVALSKAGLYSVVTQDGCYRDLSEAETASRLWEVLDIDARYEFGPEEWPAFLAEVNAGRPANLILGDRVIQAGWFSESKAILAFDDQSSTTFYDPAQFRIWVKDHVKDHLATTAIAQDVITLPNKTSKSVMDALSSMPTGTYDFVVNGDVHGMKVAVTKTPEGEFRIRDGALVTAKEAVVAIRFHLGYL